MFKKQKLILFLSLILSVGFASAQSEIPSDSIRRAPSTNIKGFLFSPNVLIPRTQKLELCPGSPLRCTATTPAKRPAKLFIFLQRIHDGASGIQWHRLGTGAGITVGDRYFDVTGIAVRIHVGGNIEPGVQRWKNTHADHDDRCCRVGKQPPHITGKDLKYLFHTHRATGNIRSHNLLLVFCTPKIRE